MNFALHFGLIQKYSPILTTEEAPPPCGPTRSVEDNRDQSLSDTSPSPSAIGKTDDTTVVIDHIDGEQHSYFISLICKCKFATEQLGTYQVLLSSDMKMLTCLTEAKRRQWQINVIVCIMN